MAKKKKILTEIETNNIEQDLIIIRKGIEDAKKIFNILYKIEIIQLIESKYNVTINDDEIENIITFEDIINLVKSKLIS